MIEFQYQFTLWMMYFNVGKEYHHCDANNKNDSKLCSFNMYRSSTNKFKEHLIENNS